MLFNQPPKPQPDPPGKSRRNTTSPEMNYVRRFVFVHYEDLLEIRFKKLEKVTDKLYVFIPDAIENVPLWLVRQMQKMGPDVDWIELGDVNRKVASSFLSFHIGILHEKVDMGVEFAVLSDDDGLDPLVAHIQELGRSCIRVKQRLEQDPGGDYHRSNEADASENGHSSKQGQAQRQKQVRSPHDLEEDLDEEVLEEELHDLPEGFGDYQAFVSSSTGLRNNGNGNGNSRSLRTAHKGGNVQAQEEAVDAAPLADDVVRRLIRSGNRPQDLSMLKSYILLHSDGADAIRHVDAIIHHMEDAGEIRVRDGEVAYNF